MYTNFGNKWKSMLGVHDRLIREQAAQHNRKKCRFRVSFVGTRASGEAQKNRAFERTSISATRAQAGSASTSA